MKSRILYRKTVRPASPRALLRSSAKRLAALLLLPLILCGCLLPGAGRAELPVYERERWHPTAPVPREGVRKIACIGDSITWGFGVLVPDMRTDLTYPALLERLLGDGYQVLNYGMSGRTLLAEGDAPYASEAFTALSLASGAEAFLILLGTNDSKLRNWHGSLFQQELEAFVRAYRDLPQRPRILLATPPKAFPLKETGLEMYGIRDEIIRNEIVPMVRETAEKLNVTLVDLYVCTESHPEWFPDGIHPNAEGNQALAEIFASCLRADPPAGSE